MKTKVKKIGDSLAVKIDAKLAKKMGITKGSTVDLKIVNKEIMLELDKNQRLEQLLDKITNDNKHKEVEWGRKEGNEEW